MDFTAGQILVIIISNFLMFLVGHEVGRANEKVENAAPETEKD